MQKLTYSFFGVMVLVLSALPACCGSTCGSKKNKQPKAKDDIVTINNKIDTLSIELVEEQKEEANSKF